MPDIVTSLATAEEALARTLARITTTDMRLTTPCAEWDVGALVTHTLGTAELFAATIDGEAPPPSEALAGHGTLLDDGVPGASSRILGRSAIAWRSAGDLDAVLETPLGAMPGRQLAAIATFSAVVHGWDLAAALGADREIDSALLAVVAPVAAALVPRLRSAGAFADTLPADPAAGATSTFIASLGRDPDWSRAGN